MKAQTLIVCK